jgi:exopolysaccharide production protein ExoQ
MNTQKPTIQPSITSTFANLELERKRKKNSPKLNNMTAIISLILTTAIAAYGSLFGPVCIIVLYALWFPRIKYRGVFLLRPSKDILYCILFSGWCCMSVIWSDYRLESLKGGLELVSTMMCVIIMAKLVRTEAFVRGIVFGSTLVLAASLISNKYGLDPFSNTYTLIGLFGSKNQLGLFAEISIMLSLISLLIKQNIFKKVFYCFIPFCVGLVCLYFCRSAASTVSLALTMLFLILIYVITRLSTRYRTITFVSAAIWLTIAISTCFALNLQNLLFKSVGKDSTLTGRTVLWDHGIKAGWESPIIGHGFSAFWVRGNPLAEHLWFDFGISTRMGFHFHNLFVELFVELGIVGLIIMLSLMIVTFCKSLMLTLRHGMVLEYVFPLSISVMFMIRSLVELDIMGAFSIGTILFFSILPRLAIYRRELADKAAPESTLAGRMATPERRL